MVPTSTGRPFRPTRRVTRRARALPHPLTSAGDDPLASERDDPFHARGGRRDDLLRSASPVGVMIRSSRVMNR
jgi:hypothetical protein